MKARRVALVCAAAGAIYLIALIATVPVAWIAGAVERASAHKLVLREPAGSLWAGSGRLYADPKSGPLLELGLLRWSTSWSAIFTGKLAMDLALGEASPAMQLQMSPTHTTIRGLKLELPARILSAYAPGLEAFGPEGVLRVRSDDLRFDDGSILGLAEIEWRQIRLARGQGLNLGSHVARLRGGGSKVDIEFGTIEGPLRLSGGGSWVRDVGLALSGTAEHGAEQPPALATFLRGVCTEYRDRRCVFRVKP
jgi:hypothetical protein